MKKSITMLAVAFGVTGAFAQDLTSKKGEPILPEAGDWAISVDATPFLNYAGNFFGKNANNVAPTFNFFNGNQTVVGKYFTDASTAFRAGIRLGFGGPTVRNQVRDLSAPTTTVYPAVQNRVENVYKTRNTNVGLSFGYEKRKGKTRLQGFYGGDLGIGINSVKETFEYGNALVPTSTSSTAPTVFITAADNFTGANNVVTASSLLAPSTIVGNQARITERKSGLAFSFGLRAFIGAEYFIAPKLSLGGEFGWGIGATFAGVSRTTYETVGNTTGNALDNAVNTTEIEGDDRQGSFTLDTDNMNGMFGPSGSLRLGFHF
jgi:hypothetical protein